MITAVACAEFGAHALAYWPSSSLLWYLNLEVFRPVQYSVVAEGRTWRFRSNTVRDSPAPRIDLHRTYH